MFHFGGANYSPTFNHYMRSNYDRALSYAWKCCPPLYKDITHTAYVRHFNKHGTNLFDRDIYVVLRWVKNVWFNEVRSNRYQKNGELFNRQFYTIDESPLDKEYNAFCPTSKTMQPDQELISKEFYQELFKRVDEYTNGRTLGCQINTNILRQFLSLVDNGYTYPEICEELGMSAQRVHYYKKKIQKIIKQMEINNPFHGNKAQPVKTISFKTYAEKYKQDYVCDFNRQWCDENETTMLVVHKDREEYILVKRGKD